MVPGAGPLTAAPHDAVARQAWAAGGGGPVNPQDLNRYAYAGNNPVKHTDPTGHCVPGIGDCRPVWELGQGLNWHDGAEFLSGVGEGVLSVASSVVTTPIAVAVALADPAAAVQGIEAQAATVVRGAQFLLNDPSGAAAALNDDPHALGTVAGQALGTVALAAAKGLAKTQSGNEPIYRAVSEAEFKDLESTGVFRSHPGGLSAEGKYFAERPEHATKWGNAMFGEGNYRVIKGQVNAKVPYSRWEKLDGIGPARFYERSSLSKIRYSGEVDE